LIEQPCLHLKKRFTRTTFVPSPEVRAAVLTDRVA
jgi:hypothetical protein